MNKFNVFDRSEELLIQRWHSGVKLVRPDDFPVGSNSEKHITPPSVKQLFEMPFNVYFLNTESIIQNMSERTAQICGFEQRKNAIGNSARAVSTKESADFSINHNNEVIANNSIIIKNEHFMRLDNFGFDVIAIKFPLLNHDAKITGVFGCSIRFETLAESLHLLMQTGLLANNHLPLQATNKQNSDAINDLLNKLNYKSKQPITLREAQCLFYLLKGKSARETGLKLFISQRTVEFHLNVLKEKLNCRKKSELIEKASEMMD